jgi:hypothetical protein
VFGLRIISGIVLPIVWAGVLGCGGSPATSPPEPAAVSHAPNPQAVLAKLQALCDTGQQRYRFETNVNADVAAWYLAELDAIDLSGCPDAFDKSFQSYKQAWETIRQRGHKPPDGKNGTQNVVNFFQQLKDELLPAGRANGRDDDPLLNTLLIRARELKRAAGS